MINPPSNCPSCDSKLIWVKDQLYCRNDFCPAKSFKQIEHFAKTLKIKGLGPSSIEKLKIENIFDIYELTIEYMEWKLNSSKIATKLFDEIERSTNEPLNTVLPAFGIPLVGKTATDKLSKVVDCIWGITPDICKKAGLGPKVTENLINWLDNNLDEYTSLPFDFKFSNQTKSTESLGVICLSGKLNSFSTKAEAKKTLEDLGYIVKDSLTKDVTILVNESGVETAKVKKAAESGIKIVTNLKTYIGEY